jgi:hypothetical protein
MIGLLLPPRDLTEDERAGFRMALGVLATWGRQLAAQSALTGGMPERMSPVRLLQARGEFLVDMCAAMDRTPLALGGRQVSTGAVQGASAAAALPATSAARADGAGGTLLKVTA